MQLELSFFIHQMPRHLTQSHLPNCYFKNITNSQVYFCLFGILSPVLVCLFMCRNQTVLVIVLIALFFSAFSWIFEIHISHKNLRINLFSCQNSSIPIFIKTRIVLNL